MPGTGLSVFVNQLTKSSKQFHATVAMIVPVLRMSQVKFRGLK